MDATTFSDDEVKILYAITKLSTEKPPFKDLAAYMGLKEGATRMRVMRLLDKADKKFGPVGAAAADAGADGAAAATTTAPTKKAGKRKQPAKDEVKDEADEEAAETKQVKKAKK